MADKVVRLAFTVFYNYFFMVCLATCDYLLLGAAMNFNKVEVVNVEFSSNYSP